MEVIKRIVPRKNFRAYNIPDSFGEKAEIIILPYQDNENLTAVNESLYLMKAQEQSGFVNMLNEPEENAWNEL
ncbi:MAG: hypothetical protein R6U85_13305 [Salinivirgaceae bacterium]